MINYNRVVDVSDIVNLLKGIEYSSLAIHSSLQLTYEYTYDKYGNLISQSIDYNGDGIADLVTTYSYDVNHNLISEIINFNIYR